MTACETKVAPKEELSILLLHQRLQACLLRDQRPTIAQRSKLGEAPFMELQSHKGPAQHTGTPYVMGLRL